MAGDINVLVGIEGSGQIDGASGKLIKKELDQIVSQITGNKMPRIQVAIDINKTKNIFKQQLQGILKDTKLNTKINIDTGVQSKVQAEIKAAINNINAKPIAMEISPHLNANKINTSAKDINKKIAEILSKSEKYSDYYIGKTSKRKVSGSDDRLIFLQLYNDEMKKAITLKYKYDSEENNINFVSQEDINNTKQLLDLQEKLVKSNEKLRQKQYDIFNGFDVNLQKLDSSYLSGAKKIVDTDKLDILSNKRAEINAKLLEKAPNGIVSDKAISDIKKMISEYELLIKVQKEAQYAANKLATGTFEDSQGKALSGFEKQVAQLNKLQTLSIESKTQINTVRKAIKNADDAVSLKHATDQFSILKDNIQAASNQLKSYKDIAEIRDSGRMFVSDRSKEDPIKTIEQQLLAGNGISKVSISGKNYFDGQQEQLKSFQVTVTNTAGEVKKLNFELANIGRRKGYVQSDESIVKSVTNLKNLNAEIKKQNDYNNKLASYNQKITQISGYSSSNDEQIKAQNLVTQYQKLVQLNSKIQSVDMAKLVNPNEIKQYNNNVSELTTGFKNLQTSIGILSSDKSFEKKITDDKAAMKNLELEFEKFKSLNDHFYGKNTNRIDTLGNGISSAVKNEDWQQVRKLKGELKELQIEMQRTGQSGQSFFAKLGSQMSKLGVYFSAATVMMGAATQVKKMVSNVIELDTAMTDLKKVTDETNETYSSFLDNAEVRAKKLGATLTDTVLATADAARMGYNLSESEALSDSFVIYKNVGDGIKDIEQASSSTVSAMKAFGVSAKDSISIIDSYNEVSNEFAVRSDEIGLAVSDMGAAFAGANNNIHEAIGVYTGMNEIIQDWSKSSTAMRTIAARLRNTSGELQEMGIDSEGAAESVTLLQQKLKGIAGVDIMKSANEFKSTTQILRELSGVWDELSDKDRADITRLVSGTRQQSTLQAVLTNWDKVEEAIETSMTSSGSAYAENEKYLNSIQGKISQFQAQFEALSNSFINSDLINFAVDTGTGLLGTLTSIVDNVGALPTLISIAAGAASGLTNKGGLKIKSSKTYLRPFAADGNIGQDQYEYGVLCLGAA